MSRPLVLAADIGTSSLKAALVADDGAVRATARRAYETNTPRSGWAEQNPHDWLVALKGAVSDLSERTELGELAGLVVTGQMSAGLLVDADLSPLTPCLIWSDQRATAEAQRAESLFGAASLYRLTGNPASATYTAPKIRWFAHHAVDAFGRARRFLQPKDWLIGQLTGRVATDVSDASCTGLLDISRSCWADELFRLYQLDAGLAPEIIPAGSIAGRLRAEVASQIGLTPGLPIVMGGGDGPVAAAGSGALADGDAHASLGTSAWISFVSQRPVLDPESRLATYAHVVPGHVVETGPMQSAGAALEWAARLLGTQPSALAEMALRGPMPAATAPLFLPYIQGERAPWWFSGNGGTLIGLGRSHDRETLAAAVFEGILFQLRLILSVFAQRGQATDALTVVGAFGRSDQFAQRFADTTGQGIRLLRNAEHATALGAAMLGFVGLQVLPDLAGARSWIQHEPTSYPREGTELATKRYDIFAATWPAVRETSARLADLAKPR